MSKSIEPIAQYCDALAVVRTPLQLLNAIEAKHHFGFVSVALMILEHSQYRRTPLDRACVELADWASVTVVELNPLPPPRALLGQHHWACMDKPYLYRQSYRRHRFNSVLRPWRHVPNLLIGNYSQAWFRHAAQRCSHSRCILLDDGTDTLRIVSDRERGRHVPAPGSFWKRPQTWWTNRYVNWDDRQRREVIFFSTFQLDVPATDQLVPNTFSWTRARVQKLGRDQRCMFLGQPLVEDGYLDVAVFRRALTKIKQSVAGFELCYVPHPRENRAELLRHLTELEIPVLDLDRAFEFYLLSAPTLPAVVASFFCSALDNCRLICGDSMGLIAFRLTASDLLVEHDFVRDIYHYFETRGAGYIEVLEPGQALQ